VVTPAKEAEGRPDRADVPGARTPLRSSRSGLYDGTPGRPDAAARGVDGLAIAALPWAGDLVRLIRAEDRNRRPRKRGLGSAGPRVPGGVTRAPRSRSLGRESY
jgi:hypothetical protein